MSILRVLGIVAAFGVTVAFCVVSSILVYKDPSIAPNGSALTAGQLANTQYVQNAQQLMLLMHDKAI